MPLMIPAAEPVAPAAAVQTQAQASGVAPVFEPIADMETDRPLAVLVRSSAERNWKPIVQEVLASWASTGVAPGCTDSAVDPDSIVARDAVEALPITMASGGERVAQGAAIVRTVTPWCGGDRKINVAIVFQNSQSRGMNLSVGDTVTGPRLYADILQQTAPVTGAVLDTYRASCIAQIPAAVGRLTDTEVTSMTGEPPNPAGWTERWTWTVCGRETTVDVVLTVQPDGSTRFALNFTKP